MLASLPSTCDLRVARADGCSSIRGEGAFGELGKRSAMSILMACQTPLLALGSFGGNGKASLISAPTTAVARMSLVAGLSDSFDPGGLGDHAPASSPADSEVRWEFSNMRVSVPTGITGVSQVPSGRRFSSWQLPHSFA